MPVCKWCGYPEQPGQAIHAECARKRIADLEAALREIIAHCETHSDGSWAEDEPWVIAKRALGDPAKAAKA